MKRIGKLPKMSKYSFNVDSYIDTEISQMYGEENETNFWRRGSNNVFFCVSLRENNLFRCGFLTASFSSLVSDSKQPHERINEPEPLPSPSPLPKIVMVLHGGPALTHLVEYRTNTRAHTHRHTHTHTHTHTHRHTHHSPPLTTHSPPSPPSGFTLHCSSKWFCLSSLGV